jgi:hypothetical protein
MMDATEMISYDDDPTGLIDVGDSNFVVGQEHGDAARAEDFSTSNQKLGMYALSFCVSCAMLYYLFVHAS